jgi:hypothetical protein
MTISLAFLAPNLIKAAARAEWSRQFEVLGLSPR